MCVWKHALCWCVCMYLCWLVTVGPRRVTYCSRLMIRVEMYSKDLPEQRGQRVEGGEGEGGEEKEREMEKGGGELMK